MREWEAAFRTTRKPGAPLDAVYIVAERAEELVVVSQFRPATGMHVIEFPAGLVDAGEDPAAAALRELREETGHEGAVTRVGPATFSDPGCLEARQAFVSVDVDASKPPRPALEDGEFIEVTTLPLNGLSTALESAAKARGALVDGALHAYALGLQRG
ncbi:NUDIX hydrolase domain-like protein, partial [Tribonema minus]